MKATGIVRRVDELGRVVIPKEIRKTMGIREGEPMEIFLDTNDDTVCFRKYSTGIVSDLTNLSNLVESFTEEGDAFKKKLLALAKEAEQLQLHGDI